MGECKVYKAFNDYFMDCRHKPQETEKKKPEKAKSPKKSTYVPPASVDFPKYGFNKYQ